MPLPMPLPMPMPLPPPGPDKWPPSSALPLLGLASSLLLTRQMTCPCTPMHQLFHSLWQISSHLFLPVSFLGSVQQSLPACLSVSRSFTDLHSLTHSVPNAASRLSFNSCSDKFTLQIHSSIRALPSDQRSSSLSLSNSLLFRQPVPASQSVSQSVRQSVTLDHFTPKLCQNEFQDQKKIKLVWVS